MNEFIIEDVDNYFGVDDKRFYTISELSKMGLNLHYLDDGKLYIFEIVDNDSGDCQQEFKHKTFNYIGKTDINDKKIYADCSIIEFEYNYEDYGWQDFTGYFVYSEYNLKYKLNCYENNTLTTFNKGACYFMTFEQSRIRNIKIIDTIQENKLGLIK